MTFAGTNQAELREITNRGGLKLLQVIVAAANEEREFSLSLNELHKRTELPATSISRYLTRFMEKGWIEKLPNAVGDRGSKQNRYRFIITAEEVTKLLENFPSIYHETRGRKSNSTKKKPKDVVKEAADVVDKAIATSTKPKTITWTDEELNAVATEFALLRTEDPFAPVADLYLQAQYAAKIPASRIKNSLHDSFYQTAGLKYRELFEDVKWEPIILQEETQPATPPPPPAPPAPVIDVNQILNNCPLPELVGTATRRMIQELAFAAYLLNPNNSLPPVVPEKVDAHTVPYLVAATPTQSKPVLQEPRKLRIAVMTLHRKGMERKIKDGCPHDVELHFLDREVNRSANSFPKSADYIIVHGASHGQWEAALASSRENRDRVIYIREAHQRHVIAKIMQLRSRYIARQSNIHLGGK